MNNLEIKLSDLHPKKLCLEEVFHELNTITFNQKKLNIKATDEIYIIIKNVKTREEFNCYHYVMENKIIIDLDNLSLYFADYEGSIYIVLKMGNNYHMYRPTINDKTTVKINSQSFDNYKWFLRILENGEIRLSSIIKK